MQNSPIFMKLSKESEYYLWKTQIERQAIKRGTLEILQGKINESNAIDLIIKMNPYSKENDMEIDHNKNTELQAKALEVYRQKESELSEILLGSITEDVFNPANIDSSTPIAKMYQNICGRFGQQENIPELQTEFYNSKLRYGDNARDFYRDLQVIFNKLRKADPTIGEQGLRHQAVQALPLELEQVKYEVYDQTETEYNYDNFVDEIVRKYDIRIKLNPPIKNMSVNQTTLLDRANKHNDRNSPEKDQTSTNNLLHRINIKFCSYCLEKRHKSPQTHTQTMSAGSYIQNSKINT